MLALTRILVLGGAFVALAACQKNQSDQNIAIDNGVPDNSLAGNADIETLPADESSTTPSNQLANGYDNLDVNSSTTNKD